MECSSFCSVFSCSSIRDSWQLGTSSVLLVGFRSEHVSYHTVPWFVLTRVLFAGFVLCIGFERTGRFFGQAERVKGTCCFFGGIAVLLLGWPVLGMILEVYGFVALFGGFMPMVGHLSRYLREGGTSCRVDIIICRPLTSSAVCLWYLCCWPCQESPGSVTP